MVEAGVFWLWGSAETHSSECSLDRSVEMAEDDLHEDSHAQGAGAWESSQLDRVGCQSFALHDRSYHYLVLFSGGTPSRRSRGPVLVRPRTQLSPGASFSRIIGSFPSYFTEHTLPLRNP